MEPYTDTGMNGEINQWLDGWTDAWMDCTASYADGQTARERERERHTKNAQIHAKDTTKCPDSQPWIQ